jgi:hypothetical protein
MSYNDPTVRARLAERGINRDKLEEYAAAFRLFDADNTGLITVDNLRYILEEQFGTRLRGVCVGLLAASARGGLRSVTELHSRHAGLVCVVYRAIIHGERL